MDSPRIAIVGAGISGLACARELSLADARVTVFDTARTLGGRLGTYRRGDFAFDHGAQYVTTRSRSFTKYVEVAGRAGAVQPWRPRILEDDREWSEPVDDWQVGTPGMSAFTRPLARGLELRTGVTVHELVQSQRGWELQTDSGREDATYDAIGIAAPAGPALTLLGGHGRAFRHLAGVRMSPCWSGLMAFADPVDAGADVRRWTRGALAWAACDSSKPQRPAGPSSWVVHASPAWSREHLEEDARDVARALFEEFARAIDVSLPEPVLLVARRWRHALVEEPLGLPCLVDEEIAAGACGDWCIAPRVEAAFESGRALAHSLMSMVGLPAPLLRR
ncbi:MAG: NAD(P)-binding protein [Steroidobacteraceae bacterium]